MDRKIALKWARALESGEYDQTTGQLRNTVGGFCCLGVLCNLHAEAHPEIAALETEETEYMGHQAELPYAVLRWAGMESDSGHFAEKSGILLKVRKEKSHGADTLQERVVSLVELNDTLELDFKQIAAVIRKHSDKL